MLEMQEAERRASVDVVLPPGHAPGSRRYALFDMDGVLLDGSFAETLADRLGIGPELALLLDSNMMAERDRDRAIASLFTGVHWEVFEEVARAIPLMPGAVDTVVALRKRGYRVGIVTDSYHVAAETVRRRVFADFTVAHVMHFRNRTSTGEIAVSPLMLVAGGCRKHDCCRANVLHHLYETTGLEPGDILARSAPSRSWCRARPAIL